VEEKVEGEGVGRRVRNSDATYICAETLEKFRRDRFSDKRKIFVRERYYLIFNIVISSTI